MSVIRGLRCGLTIVLGLIATGTLAASAATAADKPNVVLIMLDDFGYECVGANGSTSYQTPRMDRLAAEGVRGEHCHVQPLCTPTRVQLMTGLYNVRNYTHFGELERGQTTFAQVFRQAGYTTCIAGKWQLGREMSRPAHFGFDKFCLWQLDRRPPRYANPGLEIDGHRVDYTQGEYGPQVIGDYACRFVAENKDQPFLLYYPMTLTHDPFQPTPNSPDWNPRATGERDHRSPKYFADMVAYADQLIGELIDTLERHGLREKTLVLILGDNGTKPSITSRLGQRSIQGGKGSSRHTGTHVPLIANWPGTIPPGRVLNDLVDSTDFLPTICAAAGIALPSTLDGRSFLPQLRGEMGQPRPWIYCWYAREGGPTATFEFAMNQQYKLYRNGQMYDLERDLDERQPLDTAALSGEAQKAHGLLSEALNRFRDVRSAEIAAQSGPRRNDAAE